MTSCNSFVNGFPVEKLEARGIRAELAPSGEWLEFAEHLSREEGAPRSITMRIGSFVNSRVRSRARGILAHALGWPDPTSVADAVHAGGDYLRPDLGGEAILAVGDPVHAWRARRIDGVVHVGSLECMPSKVAEAQLFQVTEREGLLSLTRPLNGDPVDAEVLDGFAHAIHARHRARRRALD